jgi:hypothetical protein
VQEERPLTRTEIEEVKQYLSNVQPDEWEDMLREDGFSEGQIKQIMGR